MVTTTAITPCPYCGCPDEFDHTDDCPVLPEVVDLQRRVKELERNQAIMHTALKGTVEQCMEMANMLREIETIFNKK
jgi:hypothetical protein